MDKAILQREIDEAIVRLKARVERIELDPDDDQPDLSKMAPVAVHLAGRPVRYYTVLSLACVSEMLDLNRRTAQAMPELFLIEESNAVYVAEYPMIVALRITGEAVVYAVVSHLEMDFPGEPFSPPIKL